MKLKDILEYELRKIHIPEIDRDSRSPEINDYLIKKAEEKRRKRNARRIKNGNAK